MYFVYVFFNHNATKWHIKHYLNARKKQTSENINVIFETAYKTNCFWAYLHTTM